MHWQQHQLSLSLSRAALAYAWLQPASIHTSSNCNSISAQHVTLAAIPADVSLSRAALAVCLAAQLDLIEESFFPLEGFDEVVKQMLRRLLKLNSSFIPNNMFMKSLQLLRLVAAPGMGKVGLACCMF